MNLKIRRLTLVVAVALLTLAASNSFAQNNYGIVPITARDNGTGVAVDTLGVHLSATYCFDGTLTPGGFTEEELPPKPPTGVFDFRFTEHRSGSSCMGVGSRVHIQEPGKLDTFKIEFQPGDGGYPFRFSWGSFAPWIASDWESLVMVDGFGGILVNVNMKVDTSVTVSNTLINALFIIGKSNAPPLDVDREGDLVPQRFELQQNYPNPFNPSTTVKFAIEKTAFADVAVYNVIGQKVRTLAAEVLNPGYYTATWNGNDENGQAVTSGVYFVRMVATGEGAEFSDLRKLLLVK